MSKRKLFSVTKKDLVIETFRSGGPGGQHQNKRETGVRITHPDSGATATSREHKSQHQNKRAALQRLAETKEFKLWIKLRAAQMAGMPSVDEVVDELMQPRNLLVETRDNRGRWVSVDVLPSKERQERV